MVAIFILSYAPPLHERVPCACVNDFRQLKINLRERRITQAEAIAGIKRLFPQIKEYYFENGGMYFGENAWVFPLQGYTIVTSGSNGGKDYVEAGYNYFDDQKHGAHPSFDFFIRDRNQDCLDDRCSKPVAVLSMTGGIVVAAANKWDESSKLRGGKFIWIYDPSTDGLVYYAHNSNLLVYVGDIIKPGDIIATVGRTGVNACKKRSQTHLHLTYLRISDGYPKPVNIYSYLKKARPIK